MRVSSMECTATVNSLTASLIRSLRQRLRARRLAFWRMRFSADGEVATDIVSCFASGCPALPVYRGEIQCLALGMAVEILRDDGSNAAVNETGELCCTRSFPSMPVCFWGDENDSKYHAAYFEKYPDVWAHGDFANITEHGGMVIFGRSDATLNPGVQPGRATSSQSGK